MMTRVLVTGCAGYVGSVLCQDLLAQGFEVVGVDTFAYGNEQAVFHLLGDPNFTLLRHDVRDVTGMKLVVAACDAVVPLAAVVGAPACDRNFNYAREVNYLAVVDLLKVLSPSQRVVFPNTNSGYGETDGVLPVTEEAPFSPVSYYGVSKAAAEEYVLKHRNAASLRLATVFGPSPRMRFDLMVNDFTQRLAREGKLEVFEPHFRRNFLHVRDASRAFAHMLHLPLVGAYNVGLPDANLTKLELAHRVARGLLLDESCVTVGEGTDPDRRNYLVSNAKFLKTGFQFAHGLEEGIYGVAVMSRLLSHEAIKRMRNA